jgi:uncharacterized delta-60 repeat protein
MRVGDRILHQRPINNGFPLFFSKLRFFTQGSLKMSKLNSQTASKLKSCVLCLLFIFLASLQAAANPADLDLTFGQAGFVRTAFGHWNDYGQTSALQPDGKLLVISTATNLSEYFAEFSVARFNSDGTRDLSFGVGGYVNTPFRKGGSFANAFTVQPDGKIVVVGWIRYDGSYPGDTRHEVAIARYNPDGSLDTSFGTGGKQTVKAGTYLHYNDNARAVAIQEDGKILVLADIGPGSIGRGILRLNTDGSVDNAFGSAGVLPLRDDVAFFQLAIQPDGKILAAGSQYINYNARFAAVRLAADGSYDQSFGNAGLAVSAVTSSQDWGAAMLLQPDGKILISGANIVRLNTDGSMDTTFDQDGYASIGGALALQSDGSIVTAYTSSHSSSGSADAATMYVQRLTPSGQLDATFGTNGHVIKEFGKDSYGGASVVIDGNGKITVATSVATHDRGNTALLRFEGDGSSDSTFGLGGVLITNSADAQSFPRSVRIQVDGKILVAGTVLARYNDDGSLDTSFNGTGKANPYLNGWDMEVQPDGKIILIGTVAPDIHHSFFAVARYTSSGALDTSFNQSGIATMDLGSGIDEGSIGLLQADGKIVVAGQINPNNGQPRTIGLARVNSDGTLDSSFGIGGKVFTTVPGEDTPWISGIAQQSDGKIVLSGRATGSSETDDLLIRYDYDGLLDSTFNGTGVVVTPYWDGYEFNSDVKVQPDGKIVVAGSSSLYKGTQFVLLRYNSDGSPDYTFNGSGRAAAAVNSYEALPTSLVIQPDGKYIVAGYRMSPGFYDYGTRRNHTVILRFTADGLLDRYDWGNRGIFNLDFDGGDALDHVAIDAQGKIVLAGYIDNNFAVARLKGDQTSVVQGSELRK